MTINGTTSINYFNKPIVKTGVTINTSNPQHPFANALNGAFSYTPQAHDFSASTQSEPTVFNTSLRTHTSLRESNKMLHNLTSHADKLSFVNAQMRATEERRAGTIQVPIGRGELLEFMEEIEKSAANGEPLMAALQRQIEKHANFGPGTNDVDFLYICPGTGRVKDAAPRLGSNQPCQEFMNTAEDAVWDLAYDLEKFIQLSFFGNFEEYGLREDEVDAAIAEIKASQSEKCFARFIDLSADYKCDCCEFDESEAEVSKPEDLIDGLIEHIGEHQDRLYEEWLRLGADSRYKYEQQNKATQTQPSITTPSQTSQSLNTSLRWFDDSSIIFPQMQSLDNGKMFVPIGKNEILGLMGKIEQALADGKCYTTALQAQHDSHSFTPSTRTLYDSFLLDPNTGEITFALPLWASVSENGYNHSQHDDDVVWDLAYDLQKFIQLRVFGNSDGMSEDEVERMIAEIKARQKEKCADRFDRYDWDGRIHGRDGGEIPDLNNPNAFDWYNGKLSEEVPEKAYAGQDKSGKTESENVRTNFISSIKNHHDNLHDEWLRLLANSQYKYGKLQNKHLNVS